MFEYYKRVKKTGLPQLSASRDRLLMPTRLASCLIKPIGKSSQRAGVLMMFYNAAAATESKQTMRAKKMTPQRC